MTANLLSALSILGFALATGTAIYFWRRSTGLYSLLVEGANRYEDLRNRCTQMQEAGQKLEAETKALRQNNQALEASVGEARKKAQELTHRLEVSEHAATVNNNKLEIEKHQLTKQIEKAHAQFEAFEAQLQAAESQIETFKTQSIEERQNFEAELEKTRNKAQEMASQLKEVDEEVVRAAKRRAAQLERLYNSMKGLKEMTEERNANWERALRHLSKYICEEHASNSGEIPTDIGPLVSKALQISGNQLIEDAEVEHIPGASAAEHMEEPAPMRVEKRDAAVAMAVEPVVEESLQSKT